MRHTSSRLLSAALLALFAVFPLQVFSGDATPEIRLSGTFVSEIETNAIIEYRDGTHRLVEQGDMIDSWGRVIRIEKTRIILQTEAGDFTEVMAEGVNSVEASSIYSQVPDPQVSEPQGTALNDKSLTVQQTAQPSAQQQAQQSGQQSAQQTAQQPAQTQQHKASYGKATTTAELMTEIYQLNRRDNSVGEDINQNVARILKLSPNAKIVEIDFEPLSKDNSSLLKLEQTLAQGSVVRLIIQGDPDIKWIYLTPDPDL